MVTPKSTRVSLFDHVVNTLISNLPQEYTVETQESKAFFKSQIYDDDGSGHTERVGTYIELSGNFVNFEIRVYPVFDPLDEGLAGGLPHTAYPLILEKENILHESFDDVAQEWIQHHIYDNIDYTVHKAFDVMNKNPTDLVDELLGKVEEENTDQENIMPDTQQTVALNTEEVQQKTQQEKQPNQEAVTQRNALTIDIVYKVLKLHASGVQDETIAEVLSNSVYSIDVETVSTLITKVNNAGFHVA